MADLMDDNPFGRPVYLVHNPPVADAELEEAFETTL
jgi:hypothetical protein